jgi:hypothetical protein
MKRTVNVIETLLENSAKDVQLLATLARQGDVAAIPRRVTFRLIGSERKQVDIAAHFIDDNHYGRTHVSTATDRRELSVDVEMPLTAHVVSCVSGMMASVAALFGLTYDGWEANIERSRS